MLKLLRDTWPLLFGLFLLMVGNGMQGSLLGIRGALEGFSAMQMSLVMTGYFAGFLVSTRTTPGLIRRVGHVRVFAAMASIISAAFILYAAFPNVWAWGLLRVLVGACFASVYVVSESWLNDAATNETRGRALSVYMLVQLVGILVSQALLNVADPGGYALFVLISVAVSLSFAPILLSVSPAPVHAAQTTMALREIFRVSPLGFVGVFFLGAVFSAMFGMGAVYGTERGLSVVEISAFISAIYLGGLVMQYPVGWLSDRMDRRVLAFALAATGAAMAGLGAAAGAGSVVAMTVAGFFVGGVANPLYSLLIAHTNDFLAPEDMSSASGGMLFLFGLGSLGGPLAVGLGMEALGSWAFFGFMAAMFAAIGVYALWRMTRRPAPAPEATGKFTPLAPQATVITATVVAEIAADAQREAEAEAEEVR